MYMYIYTLICNSAHKHTHTHAPEEKARSHCHHPAVQEGAEVAAGVGGFAGSGGSGKMFQQVSSGVIVHGSSVSASQLWCHCTW